MNPPKKIGRIFFKLFTMNTKPFTSIYIVTCFIFLSACSSNAKKIMVLIKGDATIDEKAKTIEVTNAVGNTEKEINFNTSNTVQLQLTTPETKASIAIQENGYYILNAKNDTIIGSFQNYVAPSNSYKVITQAQLKKAIDSLQQLVMAKNISSANRNYFILPYTAVKITNNTNAFFIAPYHKITAVEATSDGKAPEVYRFWSIKEIRQIIADRVKDTLIAK